MLRRIRNLEKTHDVAGLIEVLQRGSGMARVAAANALGELRGSDVERALLGALRDKSAVVRASAAKALPRPPRRFQTEMVIEAVRGNRGPPTADEVVEHALWLIPSIRAVETLVDSLERASDVDRAIYLHVLGEMADERAVPVFIRYLDDPHPVTRLLAVEGLGRVRDARAVNALADRASDADRDVARAVVTALKEVGEPARTALQRIERESVSRDLRRRARRALKELA